VNRSGYPYARIANNEIVKVQLHLQDGSNGYRYDERCRATQTACLGLPLFAATHTISYLPVRFNLRLSKMCGNEIRRLPAGVRSGQWEQFASG